MDVLDYCKGIETELTAWKAKFYDMARKLDKLGSGEKQKILPNVEDLHIILAELEDRIGQLKNECPSEWSPVKKEIDDAHIDMRGKYEETMEFIGKAAPISVPG